MKVRLTRDSVCAADDCLAPHAKTVTVPGEMTAGDLARLIKREYLPRNIQGGKATWSLFSRIPIAVVAQQLSDPELLVEPESTVAELAGPDGALAVYANYHARIAPEIVVQVTRDLKLWRIIPGDA